MGVELKQVSWKKDIALEFRCGNQNRDRLNKDWFAWGEEAQGYLHFCEKQLNLGVMTKENPGRIGALCFFCSYVACEISRCYFDFLQFDES